MPTPMWIEKDKVTDYHDEVPFPVLTRNENLSFNSNGTENLLIRGDNLEALKALFPHHSNKIRIICIGPPNNEHSTLSTRSM